MVRDLYSNVYPLVAQVRVVKVYGREGASSGLGLAAAEGAGKTAGGEFVGLAVIFDFAWSIFAVRD